jgi:hypothetical protein
MPRRGRTDAERFEGFLASVLLGARISEAIAWHTDRTCARQRLLSPARALTGGSDTLVNPPLREGGDARGHHKSATTILRNCAILQAQ